VKPHLLGQACRPPLARFGTVQLLPLTNALSQAHHLCRPGTVLPLAPTHQLLVASLLLLQRFPDAMSKTVPMWAAVLNRAVHRLRGLSPSTSLAGPTVAAGTAAAGGAPPVQAAASAVPEWDCEVHLPPWVSENEANNIRQRLDGWVELLLQASPAAGADAFTHSIMSACSIGCLLCRLICSFPVPLSCSCCCQHTVPSPKPTRLIAECGASLCCPVLCRLGLTSLCC
jgi:hypothetical protein